MITPKKLIKLAKKWQKMAALGRKRITFPIPINKNTSSEEATTPLKGHFVVYTTDQKRFIFPIEYLDKYIFREILRLSDEEFGLPSDGPIKLPCDAVTMEYIVSLIQRHINGDIERALLISMATTRCSLSRPHHQEQNSQQLLVCSF